MSEQAKPTRTKKTMGIIMSNPDSNLIPVKPPALSPQLALKIRMEGQEVYVITNLTPGQLLKNLRAHEQNAASAVQTSKALVKKAHAFKAQRDELVAAIKALQSIAPENADDPEYPEQAAAWAQARAALAKLERGEGV